MSREELGYMMGNTAGTTGDVVNDMVQSGLYDYERVF
jgi:hypothetical protein